MKKVIMGTIVAFCVIAAISVTAEAALVSTFDFLGAIEYSAKGDLEFPAKFVPDLTERDFNRNNVLRDKLNSNGPYFAVGAIGYSFDLNLPKCDQECTWLLDIDLAYRLVVQQQGGEVVEDALKFKGTIDKTFDLGAFSICELVADSGADKIAAYLETLPEHAFNKNIGGYWLKGDEKSGALYFALTQPVLNYIDFDIASASLLFDGQLTLTACCEEPQTVVPEPLSVLLIGSGFSGLLMFRRKR